jgi:hypothetical protein
MQNLTEPPRNAFTADAIRALLTANAVKYSAGLELLDTSNNFVSDISDQLESGEIDRQNFATIHGTCKLVITQALVWGKDRVRPYMTVTDLESGLSARFNLGVFVMTTPASAQGEDPVHYSVSGFDLLFLLQSGPEDTYVVTSGTAYLAAVQAVLTASGIGATINLDSTLSATPLASTMVWAVAPGVSASWLTIINDLLGSINYRGLWADENGILGSGPYMNPSTRPIEWTFDTSNKSTNIIAPTRTLTSDVFGSHNWFRFVRTPITFQPTNGNGMYTVDDPNPTGRTSQAAMGRRIKAPLQFLTAADQTSLVAQGDAIVAADQAISRSFDVAIDSFPIAGHFDIVQFNDAGNSDKCQVTAWVIPLDGTPGKWTLESVHG